MSGEKLLGSDQDIDILFLDIQMKRLNGIETAREIKRRGYKGFLIFITVLKEMVFQFFETQPFDYLLKPIGILLDPFAEGGLGNAILFAELGLCFAILVE